MTDTIFALATAAGRAAVAVVRISGLRTEAVLQAMAAPLRGAG
jgi:tRNA modification GTPase